MPPKPNNPKPKNSKNSKPEPKKLFVAAKEPLKPVSLPLVVPPLSAQETSLQPVMTDLPTVTMQAAMPYDQSGLVPQPVPPEPSIFPQSSGDVNDIIIVLPLHFHFHTTTLIPYSIITAS